MSTPSKYLRLHAIFFTVMAVMVLIGCGAGKKQSNPSEIRAGDHLTSFSQEITSPVHEFQVAGGGTYPLDVTVKNISAEPWFGGGHPATVDVSYRWLDDKGNTLPIEGNRAQFDRPEIRPGESDSLKLQVVAPAAPGSYSLWVSMVQEGVDWFYMRGAKPLVVQVTVT